MIRDVQQNERPSAAWHNEVKTAADHAHHGTMQSDADGHVWGTPGAGNDLELYELTGLPELDDTFREYKATAKYCFPRLVQIDGGGHYTADATATGGGTPRYRMRATAVAETIYWAAGNRNEDREPSEPPGAAIGTRVWTQFHYGRRVVVDGGGTSATQSWFQLVLGSIEGDDYFALANPLALNATTFARNDPTAGEVAAPNTVCVVDSTRHLGCWPGDTVQAMDTGSTKLIDTATGLPPEDGHEEDDTVEEYAVWEITNRTSPQLIYPAVMGVEGVGNLTYRSYQTAVVTINGVEYQRVIFDTLLSESDSIFAGTDLWVKYDPDIGLWTDGPTPCYSPE